MNILLTTQAGGISGSTQSLIQLAKGLTGKGHKVVFAAPPNRLLHELALTHGLAFYPVPFRSKVSRKAAIAIKRIIIEEGIDIVNAQESRDRYNVILSKVIFRWKAKIVLTRRQRVADNNPIKRWIHVRFSEKIIVISHGLQQLVKRKGFPIDHTHVIHNGLPTDQYLISKSKIEELRSRYNLSPDDTVIGCVARPKRQDQLVLALRQLPKAWKLLLVGMNEEDFSRKWPNIHLEGLEDQIIFAGLIGDRSEVIHHYCLMTINVLPSQMDGFGLVSLEAMAMGVAVMGSNYGGIPDVIQHGVNGFIFQNDNIEQIVDQLKSLVNDQALRERFIKKGYDVALNKFSIERTVDEYEKFFKELTKL